MDITTYSEQRMNLKFVLARKVNRYVNYQVGGGWEVIYKGPLNFDKNYINVTIID